MPEQNNLSDSNHRKKDDLLLKSAFEETFPDLLRFFFADAGEIFDMQRKFEFLDKELGELFPEVERKGGGRFVDMLVKVFLKNGEEEWILVHIEIQGTNDKRFPHRMLQYWYRIYDRFGVNIIALTVFTGNKYQKRPGKFHKSFMGTSITYEYNVYHIFDHSEDDLLAMNNPFALIVLAAQKALLRGKIPEEELAAHRLTVAKALISVEQYNHEQIARILFFLKSFLHIGDSKINHNFDREINRLTGKRITMGIIETIKQIKLEEGRELGLKQGLERGIEQGKGQFVLNLLANTDFSMSKIAALADVSVSFVKKIKSEMK